MPLSLDLCILLVCTFKFQSVFGQNTAEGRIVIPSSEKSSSEERECKPISECKSFLYLLQKHRTSAVIQDLVARDCGFTGTTQLIWCPIEGKLKALSAVPDDE